MDISTIIGYLFGAVFCYFGVKMLMAAAEINDERKRGWRAGTHDYYGNKIDDKPYDKHGVEYRDGDNT